MPRSAKGWPALRCAPSPAPRGRCARRSSEAGGEGEGKKKKKKIRLGAGAAAQGGSTGRAVPEVPAALPSAPAERWPLPRCVCAFVYVSLHADAKVAPAGTALYPVGRTPPHAPGASELAPRRYRRYLAFCGGVVLCALRRQEGRERGPLGYAEDFFFLQNALKGAEVLAYIQLYTSANLSLCGAPKPHASNTPKSHSRRSRGQDKATLGAGPFKKKIVINPPSCREKGNKTGTNQIASLPTGPVALSPP
ncbi:PREDICTED: uncharacterized protein LOC106629158 [Pseudopodoces humilis]|uniref:uncharacterized protein LOC106629158 n=1 Tax=Pseudopodoces humilis TaxID=181119 RepID=UPI0006B7C216|nr:PREDICTED: uncharacterized protein LOC106629158 [Pseudopodoces humilis]